ncbi:MAG: hypothetical protein WB579_07215 [Bryobacteraceae bacterium]
MRLRDETGSQLVQFVETSPQVHHGSALTVQPQNRHQVDFATALRVKQTLSLLPLGRTGANLFHLQDDGPVG